MKSILFIIVLLCIYKYNTTTIKPLEMEPDIIYNTGGYYGFYQLGICHYIKQNFEYNNKVTLGISAGTWVNLFMSLDHAKTNTFLKDIFEQIPENTPIYKMPNLFKSITKTYKFEDFNITNMNIAVTDVGNQNMIIYNKFLSLDEIVRCCTASSFIPLITYNDFLFFYKNKLSVDGGLFKKKFLKNINAKKTLVIHYNMFKRFKWYPLISVIKPKYSYRELYKMGYKDALKNHAYLNKFLTPLHTPRE
jgi:hypothetical protein